MQFAIEVIQNDVVKGRKNSRGGTFDAVELVYKKDGRVEAKSFPDWANKEVYPSLVDLKKGDVKTVTTEKDTNGYWKWLALSDGGVSSNASTDGGATNRPSTEANSQAARLNAGKIIGSNYETSEERAKRQVMIVRQSSISSAISLLTARQKPEELDANTVIDVAKRFEHFVLGE